MKIENVSVKTALCYAVLMIFLPHCLLSKGKKVPRPAWYPSPRAVYPVEKYLVTEVPGSGNSAEAAKTAAVNTLAGYVSTKVESALQTAYSAQQTSENGHIASKETTDVSRNINVGVAAKLYALETTDAYYDKSSKLWYVCAFIDRAKAFAMIRSEIDAARDKAIGFTSKAAEASDMFEALRIYGAAKSAGKEFLQKAAYGALFDEKRVSAEYASDIRTVSEIDSVTAQLKASNPMYLTVTGGTGNAIFAAVSTSLQEAGFIVSSKGGCPYNVTVAVDTNIDTADMGKAPESGEQLVLYSSAKGEMSLVISANGGVAFYTFATESKGGKVSAYTKSRVENKVCAALAETIRKELSQDFERFFRE